MHAWDRHPSPPGTAMIHGSENQQPLIYTAEIPLLDPAGKSK